MMLNIWRWRRAVREPQHDRYRKKPCRYCARPELERLETRINPSTTLNALNGGLQIVIAGSDTVNLSTTNGQLVVNDTGAGQTIADTTGKFAITGAAGNQIATENASLAGDFASMTVTGTGGGQTVNFIGGSFVATNISDGTIPAVSFITKSSFFSGDLDVEASHLTQKEPIHSTNGAIDLAATGPNTDLSVNASITTVNGPVTIQTTGSLTVGLSVSINSSSFPLSLSADVTAGAAGDDGIGNLYIDNNVVLYGSNVTLRGADEEIASGAKVMSAVPVSVSATASATLTGQANLSNPRALAFDRSGNLYVANENPSDSTVSEFPPGAATASSVLSGLNRPSALAFDGAGNLYVANSGGSTVSMFAPGTTTPTSTLTGLANPAALAFDGNGNLYVANYGGASVSVFAPGTTTPMATLTGLLQPIALAFDTTGNLYVADYSSGKILVYAPGVTTPVNTLTGLNQPDALVFDASGNLYVANYGNGTVSVFAPNATSPTATLTGLNQPYALVFDAAGNLYVSNYGLQTISKFAPGTTSAAANLTGLNAPAGMVFDATGNLYVANSNSNTVSEITPGAMVATTVLMGLGGPSTVATDSSGGVYVFNSVTSSISEFAAGSTTARATLTGITGAMAVGADGTLYVANPANNTVSRFAPGTTVPSATLTGLTNPQDLFVDEAGNLYVANSNQTVSKFASGAMTPSATLTGISQPGPMAMDAQGNLYVANGSTGSVAEFAPGAMTPYLTIPALSPAPGYVSSFAVASTGAVYIPNYNQNTVSVFAPGATTASAVITGLSIPNSLAVDRFGNLYVANSGNDTVYEFPPGATMPAAQLTSKSFPEALAFDESGDLYVANSGSGTVDDFTAAVRVPTIVHIQSSLSSRPLSLGGTNDAAVPGINLTSAELAEVFTGSTSTVSIGDSNQTGNITLTTASPATTAGASIVVTQSGTGQVVLDDGASTKPAVNGNGGTITLTSGAGGIVEKSTNHLGTADISAAATVSLTSNGPIGSSSLPLQFAATSLSTDTSQANGNQFLSALGLVQSSSLNAGTGVITLAGSGGFQLNAANSIATASSLRVNSGSMVDLHGSDQTIGTLNGAGMITNSLPNSTATLTVTGGGALSGQLADGGGSSVISLVVNSPGQALILSGGNTYSGATTVPSGTLQVDGSLKSSVVVNGGLLKGNGTTAAVTLVSGTLQPGDSPGSLHTGNLTLAGGTTYIAQLAGALARTGYSQDVVSGTVNLGGATLNVQFLKGFVAAPGQTFVLIANDGSDPVVGMFAGLPEGAVLSASGQYFRISYAGGDGNDVALTALTGPLSEFLVTHAGGPATVAGQGFLIAVQAADAFGHPITTYSGPASVAVGISPVAPGTSLPSTVSIGSNGLGLFLVTVQQVGSYTITVTGAGITGSTSTPVNVTSGSPVQLAFAVQPTSAPTGVALPAFTVKLEDAFGNSVTTDNTDSVTVAVARGRSSFAAGSMLTATFTNGVATFTNLVLVTPGSYQLSAVVPGLYTGPYSTMFSITPLQVVPGSFVGSPSGFSLQFNAPFLVNSTTPVLYGQNSGAGEPSPSVIVTTDPGNLSDQAAYVAGSLVPGPATNGITFVATNTTLEADSGVPILPDGNYTVIVRSNAATHGFQALNSGGGFLDGLGTGTAGSGDFAATFTVNAAAAGEDAVWVPATADGPGQPLSAPGMNQVGGGYPVYLDDKGGVVTDAQATLSYNPVLLTVTPTSTATFTITVPSPGTAMLHYNGPALAAGSQTPIGFITAAVPAGTAASPIPYKAEDLLHLLGVSLNGGSLPVTTSDGVHLVAYVGDADGNGAYTSNDAVLITRVAVQTDTGFAAYPLVDPLIVADTDGSGFIPADAALQVNEAGVGLATANLPIPPIPTGVHFQALVQRVSPSVRTASPIQVGAKASVPDLTALVDYFAQAGADTEGTFRMPVNVAAFRKGLRVR